MDSLTQLPTCLAQQHSSPLAPCPRNKSLLGFPLGLALAPLALGSLLGLGDHPALHHHMLHFVLVIVVILIVALVVAIAARRIQLVVIAHSAESVCRTARHHPVSIQLAPERGRLVRHGALQVHRHHRPQLRILRTQFCNLVQQGLVSLRTCERARVGGVVHGERLDGAGGRGGRYVRVEGRVGNRPWHIWLPLPHIGAVWRSRHCGAHRPHRPVPGHLTRRQQQPLWTRGRGHNQRLLHHHPMVAPNRCGRG
mmetsp:Transcript_23482/g.58005  ORF Transcript_23482/g.58005 Transcript_23482/m.58005 type:complete len:253 (+) Transcript_23482:129-887(+)